MNSGVAKKYGKVFLVGAGPGAPEYLTLRASEVLGEADVVVYDNLVGEGIIRRFAGRSRKIYVGKKAGSHSRTQEETCALLVKLASRKASVVRLKGGDPFIFGRGAEEAQALQEAGIPFEVVPGITAAQGASATAGIPLTHRGRNAAVTLVTGHEDPAKDESTLDYGALARVGHLVFYMGIGRLEGIANELMKNGMGLDTPAALVRNATRSDQAILFGTVFDIAEKAKEAGIEPPALVFFGANADPASVLDWFSTRPLFGRTVVVTRSRAQASELSIRLESLGARAVESPSISIRPVTGEELAKVDRAVRSLHRWDWVVFTSVNGVDVFLERLRARDLDARAFAGLRIGAIGPATAGRLEAFGIKPDFVPTRYSTETFCREIFRRGFREGHRFLLARAREANPQLAKELRTRKARVTVLTLYDTVPDRTPIGPAKDLLRREAVDAVTFTSSSTVRFFRERIGVRNFRRFAKTARYASIGPVTSQTIREFGVEPALEAKEHTLEGLVNALLEFLGNAAAKANRLETRNPKLET